MSGYLPLVHLLRVQEIFFLLALLLPAIALTKARDLLANFYDLDPRGTYFAVLTAQALSWSVLLTGFIVLRHLERFGLDWLRTEASGPGWLAGLAFCVLVAPTVIAIRQRDPKRFSVRHVAAAAGAVATAIAIGLAADRVYLSALPLIASIEVPCSAGNSLCRGYIENGHIAPSHVFAAFAFAFSAILYGLIGWFRWPAVPTVAYVHIWLSMLCWPLGAIAFFVDGWRFSLLLTVAIVLFLSGYVFHSKSDHYFGVVPCEQSPPPPPEELLSHGGMAIVVATNGGGIQSAAWTARVLTGLDLQWRHHKPSDPGRFRNNLRLISGVSGGSVGTMHFLDTYRDPLPSDMRLEEAVRNAEASSLADVAWGLVYPDFLGLIAPMLVKPLADRGNALERAWVRNGGDSLDQPLSEQYAAVRAGRQPAVVYNATITETGERVLLGTTGIEARPGDGRRNLSEIVHKCDVHTVTAARLSASFPFVTPAARPIDGLEKGFHVVDGGYYDNYGIVTALEWLDEGLRKAERKPKRILLIQLLGAPASPEPAGSARGWAYQLFAPIACMLAVRSAGQLAHKTLEQTLFDRLWYEHKVEVVQATFAFPGANPPLSWHLSEGEKQAIESEWRKLSSGPEWIKVRNFLDTAAVGAEDRP